VRAGAHADFCDLKFDRKDADPNTGLFGIAAASNDLPARIGRHDHCGGRCVRKRESYPKTHWDLKADRAIERARGMPQGPGRHDAMKRAGLLRNLAALMREIAIREKPIRGKKPYRPKQNDPGELLHDSHPNRSGDLPA
jgi:hypothetical protein